ncbi:MAG: tetratricopeptide repeat protein [Candidatus Sulfotelmatobacter sp.]
MRLSPNVLRLSLLVIALAVCASVSAHAEQAAPAKLPVSTSSSEAAQYFEAGMVNYENHKWNLAVDAWNRAIKADPNFAQAYVWICFVTGDPAEETRDRVKAKSLIKSVSPGEQLLIRWLVGVRENHYVEGIMAMNDMLAMFPHDKRLNFMAGYWLFRWQDEYEISKKFTLRALAEDPNYAPCYNQIGYIYSREGDIDKALESIAKYISLLPNEPNPHDSYGEMLRFAGRYEEALEQYRLALKIDPTFYISQKELGETYSLMGEEAQARKEYEKAIEQAPSVGAKAEYSQKLALTYVREKKYAEADAAYLNAAAKARSMEQWIWEVRAHRVVAMYEPDHAAAMKNLDQAEALLSEASGKVAQIDLQEEKAHILRVRAERSLDIGDTAAAAKLVAELEKMTSQGSSVTVERIYHGAAGTLLVAQKNYADAIPQLEEDLANPLSMKLLIAAYRETGDADEAANLSRKLRTWKVPSVEEALATADSSSAKNVVAVKN